MVVRLVLASPDLDPSGFVVDYGDLSPFKDWLWAAFDHRHLNDVVDFQPSAENMARFLYEEAVRTWGWPVATVGWSETPPTWAMYSSGKGVGKIDETPAERENRIQGLLEATLRGEA